MPEGARGIALLSALTTGVDTRRGWAARPTLGRVLAGLVVTAAVVAGLSNCGGHRSQGSNPYGATKFNPTFPSFLPAKSVDPMVDQVLVGTAQKPALSVEGEAIEVHTPNWTVLINVSGPVVPGEGLPYQASATTCTWTITLSKATAEVPVSMADFNTVDHLGNIYHLTSVEGQGPPPATIGPGQTVSFEVRAYEIVGEGIMRWAPVDQQIVAEWDFEVEND